MIKYSTVISIAKPPAVVMAALLDGPRYEQWTDMVDSRFEDGPRKVGTRGSFRFAKGPLKGAYDMEITRLEPDRRLEMTLSGAAIDWKSVITLAQKGDGTEMTYAGDVRLLGWRRLLEPLMAGEVRKGEAREAQQLKKLLEAE